MKGFNQLGIGLLILFILLSLSGINLIRSAADTLSAPQNQTKPPEQMLSDAINGLRQQTTIPLWLLLLIILIILVVK